MTMPRNTSLALLLIAALFLFSFPAAALAQPDSVPTRLASPDWPLIQSLAAEGQVPVYFKASNTNGFDYFGSSVAVSGDTLVVGASGESSASTGINGDQTDNSAPSSGAVYVFIRSGLGWEQQAYIKASNAEEGDRFGTSVSISGDTIVVGAHEEDGNRTGGESNNDAADAGAAYIFVRSGTSWSQQAYLKASNAEMEDYFGNSVSISGDTVVVAAHHEASSATGVNGDQNNNSAAFSGAAYVFTRSGTNWSQQAYLKASNTEASDLFGTQVALDGDLLVVGAPWEDGDGIGGDPTDNSISDSGAVYTFSRSGTVWSQRDYIKASNPGVYDQFGWSVALNNLAVLVGAKTEDGGSPGVNGDPSDNSVNDSGAAYLFLLSSGAPSWQQIAYLKASNPEAGDYFGWSVALDYNGNALVSAIFEASDANGVNGDQVDNSAQYAGAAYYFTGDGGVYHQKAYLKATNSDGDDLFGSHVALARENLPIDPPAVIGAKFEDSSATGVNGDQSNNYTTYAGAVYIPDSLMGKIYLPALMSAAAP